MNYKRCPSFQDATAVHHGWRMRLSTIMVTICIGVGCLATPGQVQPVPRNELPIFPTAQLKGSDLKAAKIAAEMSKEFRNAKSSQEGLTIARGYLRSTYTDVTQALKAVRAISHADAISSSSIAGLQIESDQAWLALVRLGTPSNPEHARVALMGASCILHAKVSLQTARSVFSLYGDNEELPLHAYAYLNTSTRERSVQDQVGLARRLALMWENSPKGLVFLGRADATTSRHQLGLIAAFHWRYLAHNEKHRYGLGKSEAIYLELLKDQALLAKHRKEAETGLAVVRRRMAEDAKKGG